MEIFKLLNGLTVILDKRPCNTVVCLATVKVGSNDESVSNNGISHFIEHAVFTRTKSRNALQISKDIETLGGELNAGTTPEKTFFFVRTLSKHIATALDVLSELVFEPIFEPKNIEREKLVVTEEIDYIYDDFSYYQWVVFQSKLFKGPQRQPVYGSKKSVMNLTMEDIIQFHNKYYVPNNIILTITGNIPKAAKQLIRKHFSSPKPGKLGRKLFREPRQQKTLKTIRLPTQSSYLVMGYKVPPRGSPKSLYFDIFCGVLGRGQSGTLFHELRNKRGLAYSVGAYHFQGYQYNFFSLYANLKEKNIPPVKRVFLEQLQGLRKLDAKSLREAKTYIEGDFLVGNEDNLSRAHTLTQWELAGDVHKSRGYVGMIKRLALTDIRKAAKGLDDNYCLTTIRPGKPS